MSGIKLPTIARPNGTTYRPRKITTEIWGDEDEVTDVVVFGTHDVNFSRPLAVKAAEDYTAEFLSGWRLEVADESERVWRTRRLACFDEGQPIYQWWHDPMHGRAGVRFRVAATDDWEPTPEPDPNQMALPL